MSLKTKYNKLNFKKIRVNYTNFIVKDNYL